MHKHILSIPLSIGRFFMQVCSGGQCRNTPGSFQCICPTGTQLNLNTHTCEDIDECKELGPEAACFNGECVNTFGSYRCECDDNSVLDNTGRICIGKHQSTMQQFE